MSYIYIGGDSFCKYRGDQDWPKQLADLFGCQIQGKGFEGESWWHTRIELSAYIKSEKFSQTALFVFCHTDSHRILTDKRLVQNQNAEIDHAREIYYKYIHNYHVHNWVTANWYQELNQQLADKQVIHIQCFESTKEYFATLQGLKFSYPLTTISLGEIKQCPEYFFKEHLNNSKDFRRNHFSEKSNQLLAQFIYDHYRQSKTHNELITDNFLTHRGVGDPVCNN